MKISRVGVDLAKNIFQLHGVDRQGNMVWKRRLSRDKWLKVLYEKVEPGATIGMEACTGAHHWARLLNAKGYRVKLIPPQFVKPFVKSNKNDANDAQAICEAMMRPNMHPVMVKIIGQQDLQAIHRIRSALKSHRNAIANQIRGLVSEYGLVAPKQHSSGGKERLLGITKRGDSYLRSMLVNGAHAVIKTIKGKSDRLSRWVINLLERRHPNVVAIALANKIARIAWAIMTKGDNYNPDFNPV